MSSLLPRPQPRPCRRFGARGASATVVVLLASVAAGCGGGAHGRRAVTTRGGRGVAPASYRWLVPTTGPQPTVAEENAHPGTTTWRLPGPAADVGGLSYGSVTGYVAEQALDSGQTERIYVSAPGARHVRIRVYRMGWYGGTGGREVLATDSLPVVAQPPCAHRSETGLTVCDWHPTLSFVIPPALPSGVYVAKLSTGEGARDCLFVVRPAQPQPLLAQLPTATYEAYNRWGGDSLYPGGIDRVRVTGTTQGVAVSYDRPYDGVTGAGEFFSRDVAMVRFLERYDYRVSYTTSESVDSDPSQLTGHHALIDFGHSEYWSQRQENAFARARDAGTSLLFFGSDTLGWRVRYAAAGPASSEAGRPGHVIIAYKEHASLDPDRSDTTGPFPDRGARLTASAYLGCTTARVQQPGPSTYRYYPWTPAPGLRPSWLFAHTGIRATTRIPGIVGYELDQHTPLTPAGTRVAGSGAVRCTIDTAPEPNEPMPGPGDDLAETTIYTARSGAIVFNTGTMGWELGLEPVPSASPDAPLAPDPRVVAMTRDLIARVLRRSGATG
jgi:hypothetical protein